MPERVPLEQAVPADLPGLNFRGRSRLQSVQRLVRNRYRGLHVQLCRRLRTRIRPLWQELSLGRSVLRSRRLLPQQYVASLPSDKLCTQLKLIVFVVANGVCSACTSKYAYAATCNTERVLSW